VDDIIRLALPSGLSATLLLAVTLGSALVGNPAANAVVPESHLGMADAVAGPRTRTRRLAL